jgi:hypothetical protein
VVKVVVEPDEYDETDGEYDSDDSGSAEEYSDEGSDAEYSDDEEYSED